MIAMPFVSIIFPILLFLAGSLTPNSSEQFSVITLLFGANRIYLYILSTTIVALAALRGAKDPTALGQRVVGLTEELLYSPSLDNDSHGKDDEARKENSPAMIQSLSENLGDSLDEVSGETQALILPLLVSALLASSAFFLRVNPGTTTEVAASSSAVLLDSLKALLPTISQIWNAGVLTLFCRCEIRRLFYRLDNMPTAIRYQEWVPWLVGAGITGLAYFGGGLLAWPAQNFVNMALAVLVSRAIQINTFPAIVGALTLLTIYDATSTLLIPPAMAISATMDSTTMDASSTSTIAAAVDSAKTASSAMGAVAMNKLSSSSFQPGLLVTRIGDRLGGALGLGDAVFPSLLATFARRYDLESAEQESAEQTKGVTGVPLFTASMGGYIAGCLACEFVPFLSTSGVPALVFIIPLMLGSVVTVASSRGEFESLWNYNPDPELKQKL
jgi:hypothetical protein